MTDLLVGDLLVDLVAELAHLGGQVVGAVLDGVKLALQGAVGGFQRRRQCVQVAGHLLQLYGQFVGL